MHISEVERHCGCASRHGSEDQQGWVMPGGVDPYPVLRMKLQVLCSRGP